jgi:MFS family permease
MLAGEDRKLHGAKRLSMANIVVTAIEKAIGFVRRQKHNYRISVARSAAGHFLLTLTAQTNSIYTVALGADSVTLGTINSIGSGIGALISMPVGWLMDRFGIKPFYLAAMGLLAGGTLVYALAPTWEVIVAAVILLSISTRLTGTGCSVICADSVENEDRATAQNLCVTVSSIAGLMAPLIAAHLITLYGGLNAEGIRPLYYIRFVGYALLFVFVALQLREPQTVRVADDRAHHSLVSDFRRLFEAGGPLRRWVIIASLTQLPMAMTSPFLQLYAHQEKGADQYTLGIMTTATVLARLVFGVPLGRLADKAGRKKVIYLLTPLWYASNLLLVFSPSSITLIMAGALQTFYSISSGVTSAMTLELVPLEQMGKWSGVLGLARGLVAIPAPVIGGLIWRELGPMYVFVIPLALDLALRIPLLITIPETLGTGHARASR